MKREKEWIIIEGLKLIYERARSFREVLQARDSLNCVVFASGFQHSLKAGYDYGVEGTPFLEIPTFSDTKEAESEEMFHGTMLLRHLSFFSSLRLRVFQWKALKPWPKWWIHRLHTLEQLHRLFGIWFMLSFVNSNNYVFCTFSNCWFMVLCRLFL